MKIVWSPSETGFFIEGVSSVLPSDAVPVERARYDQLMDDVLSRPLNRLCDDNGQPIIVRWRSDEENAAVGNDLRRQALMSEATAQIDILQPAVDGGYATPEDIAALPQWKRYRYELFQMVTQPSWPESPQWPTEPEKVI